MRIANAAENMVAHRSQHPAMHVSDRRQKPVGDFHFGRELARLDMRDADPQKFRQALHWQKFTLQMRLLFQRGSISGTGIRAGMYFQYLSNTTQPQIMEPLFLKPIGHRVEFYFYRAIMQTISAAIIPGTLIPGIM